MDYSPYIYELTYYPFRNSVGRHLLKIALKALDKLQIVLGVAVFAALGIWIHNHHALDSRPQPLVNPPELLQNELAYEQEFTRTDKPPYLWATIQTEGGQTVRGRVVFTTECPTGQWCAEPDTSIRDDRGDDVTLPDHDDMR